MNKEFTILKSAPPARSGTGNPKSELRTQIEALKVGEVLQWRPQAAHSLKAAAGMAVLVRRRLGYGLTVRKVDQGHDIYRTA